MDPSTRTLPTARARWPWAELGVTAALVALAMAALFAAGIDGWTGPEDGCLVGGQCFCELDRGGLVRQRANTASNLGFVLVGLAIAGSLSHGLARGALPRPGNPMTETRLLPGLYAAVTALLGPGSMALHASLTGWGSVLDLASMNLFIAFVFGHALMRWRGLGVPAFGVCFAAVFAALLAVKLGLGRGSGAFGLVAVASVVVEVRLRRGGRVVADPRWLRAAVITFLASFAIWLASHNGGPLCDPGSWLQGHAIWHLGGAATTALLFVDMRSQRRGTSPAGRAPSMAKHGRAR